MINENSKPIICKHILWRTEGKKNNIVSLSNSNGGPIYFLNPVASQIIELSNGKHTVRDITNKIIENFQTENPSEIIKDIKKFLIILQNRRIITLKNNYIIK